MHRIRKKRKIVIFGLIGILLFMASGYALFSSSLSIKGSSKVTSIWDVRITNITKGVFNGSAEEATEDGVKVDPTCSEAGTPKTCDSGLTASINVDLFEVGDSAEYDITISNKGNLDAKLNNIVVDDHNMNNAVIIEYSGISVNNILYKNGTEGSSKVVHVKVSYNPEYTGDPVSGELNLTFEFTQQKDGELPSQYTLTYDYGTNGGSGESETSSYVAGANCDLTKTGIKEGYSFIGWNTKSSATTGLSSFTMPDSNVTLYAIYGKTVNATYVKDSEINQIGKNSDSCIMYNKSSSCSVTLPSITAFENYTVDGWYDGSMKVGNVGEDYNISDDVILTAKVVQVSEYKVTFDPNEGVVSPTFKNVSRGDKIGQMPIPTKENSNFGGWYTDLSEEIGEDYVPTSDITVHARWYASNIVAVMDDIGYTSLSSAISAIQGSGQKTIKIIKDISESNKIESGKNIIINLNGHSITQSSSSRVFNNNGTLIIKNGSLSMIGTTNVINNNNVMKIIGCNITSSASSGAVDNNADGNMEITDTKIKMTGNRQAVYNNGGILKVNGSSEFSNVKDRAALHNLNSGTVTIESCKITSTSNVGAIYNQSGTVTIGVNDGSVNFDNLIIQGSSYAIATSGDIYLYDGILKGINNPIDDENYIIKIEDDTEKIYDTELIGSDTYHTLYLNPIGEKHEVKFNANGGEVVPQRRFVADGQMIGDLPIPTRKLYNFVGWYTGVSSGVEVTSSYVVENDMSIFARWQKKPTYVIDFDEDGGSEVDDIEIEKGESIAKLPVSIKNDLVLEGWYLEDDFQTKVSDGFTPQHNVTLYAKWVTPSFDKVFEQSGECTFYGGNSNITGSECSKYSNKKYIDTGISLYSSENINKDYEVHFEIEEYNPEINMSQATLFNTKYESSGYPGVVFRKSNITATFLTEFELASRKTSDANVKTMIPVSGTIGVSIYRINGEIYYSINGGEKKFMNDLTLYNPTFNLTAWFGASPTTGAGTSAQRYFTGKMKNMYIKLGKYVEVPKLSLSTVKTTSSITVVATPPESLNVTKYEFSIDGGESWIDNGTSNTYVFNGLTHNTNYTIMARGTVYDNEIYGSKMEKTNSISLPTYSEEFSEVNGNQVDDVTITYPSGCGSTYTCTYQKNNEPSVTVNNTVATVRFDDDGEIVASIFDGNNYVSNSFSVQLSS